MGVNGGNTNYASSGMNASETIFQAEQGIQDDSSLFAQETLDGGHNTGDPELVRFMCNNSRRRHRVAGRLGHQAGHITMTGGMSVKRCHRPTDGSAVGLTLVPGLLDAVSERGIPIAMNCEAKELVVDGGAVTGVKVEADGEEQTLRAKAVILATGGLGANAQMVTKYRPDLEGYVTTNQPGATGDGYTMAERAGAELVQMDQIQIHPTVEQETSTLIAEGVRGSGAILVNSEGKRFFNEMSTRDKGLPPSLSSREVSPGACSTSRCTTPTRPLRSTDKSGLVKKGANAAELAAAIEVDPAALQDTVNVYNAVSASGATDEFGRTEGCIAFADGAMSAIKVASRHPS